MTRAALLLFPALAAAQTPWHVYIGAVTARTAIVAWGTTAGANTIGRGSPSHGPARVQVDGRAVETRDKNWVWIDGLAPDHPYDYTVEVNNARIGGGRFRTWPEKADRLAFFVIGDYGNGSGGQRAVAEAMAREYDQRRDSGNPVRFVLTTGDNIYSEFQLGGYHPGSGDSDRHWRSKFFTPYRRLIREIPFYPTLGNHDGNGSENRADLPVYLDNFFFPDGRPHRWYAFNYGGLADFFALDSTDNSEEGRRSPVYGPKSEQMQFIEQALEKSRAPWKIPYWHHPPFTAGPRHGPARDLDHWLKAFQKVGVKVAFQGHEHNFQASVQDERTQGIRFVVSGAGGELRSGDVLDEMRRELIEAWSPQRHFLLVEIFGREMKITPLGPEEIQARGGDGRPRGMPVIVNGP